MFGDFCYTGMRWLLLTWIFYVGSVCWILYFGSSLETLGDCASWLLEFWFILFEVRRAPFAPGLAPVLTSLSEMLDSYSTLICDVCLAVHDVFWWYCCWFPSI